MSYDLIIAPKIIEQLKGIPPGLVDLIEGSLIKFSNNPTQLSKPTAPMLAWDGPIYIDRIHFEERRHVLTAFFSYGPEVNQISITDLTLMPPYPKSSDVLHFNPMVLREPILELQTKPPQKG